MLLLIFLLGICIKESAVSSSSSVENALIDREIRNYTSSVLLLSDREKNYDIFSTMFSGEQFLDVSTEAKLSDLFKDISYISDSVRESSAGRTNNVLPQILKNLKSPLVISWTDGEEQTSCSNSCSGNFRWSGKDYYVYHLHHIII